MLYAMWPGKRCSSDRPLDYEGLLYSLWRIQQMKAKVHVTLDVTHTTLAVLFIGMLTASSLYLCNAGFGAQGGSGHVDAWTQLRPEQLWR